MSLKRGSKILFDTNIVMDLATKRDGWLFSYIAYDIANLLTFRSTLSVASTSDIAYLLLSSKYGLSRKEALFQLKNIDEMFELIDIQPIDMAMALKSQMGDYEDALLAQSALRNECDLIITRNIKDFKNSPIFAMSPEAFVEAYKPEEYEYEEILA